MATPLGDPPQVLPVSTFLISAAENRTWQFLICGLAVLVMALWRGDSRSCQRPTSTRREEGGSAWQANERDKELAGMEQVATICNESATPDAWPGGASFGTHPLAPAAPSEQQNEALAAQQEEPPQATIEAALRNYELVKKLPAGGATREDVERSSGGVLVWARASLPAHGTADQEAHARMLFATTSPSAQSSSSSASLQAHDIPVTFPRDKVGVLQECYDLGMHYPSSEQKLELANKMVRRASAFFLIPESVESCLS